MEQDDLDLNLTNSRTCKCEFLAQMEREVRWAPLEELVALHASEGEKGRPPFPMETNLRVRTVQRLFALTIPAMEMALDGEVRAQRPRTT